MIKTRSFPSGDAPSASLKTTKPGSSAIAQGDPMPPLLINSGSVTRAIMIKSYTMAINWDVMQMAQTVVRAIVEDELKVKAQAELAKQGLTLSDLVRMALREAAEGRISFSFDGVIRNRETLKAMQELDEGKGERVASLNAFHEMMKK